MSVIKTIKNIAQYSLPSQKTVAPLACLIAGAALFSAIPDVYADGAYSLAAQVHSQQSYLEESPYAQRIRQRDGSYVRPPVARRSMPMTVRRSSPDKTQFDGYAARDNYATQQDGYATTNGLPPTFDNLDVSPVAPMISEPESVYNPSTIMADVPAPVMKEPLSSPLGVVVSAPISASIPVEAMPPMLGNSSMEHTRNIILPPEIRKPSVRKAVPVRPLAVPEGRFSNNVVMPAPPVSPMLRMTEEINDTLTAPVESKRYNGVNNAIPQAVVPVRPLPLKVVPQKISHAKSALDEALKKAQRNLNARGTKPSNIALPKVKMQPVLASVIEQPISMMVEPPMVEASSAAPSYPVAVKDVAKISNDSQVMLKNFPAGLNKTVPARVKPNVNISRATVPNLELSKPEIKKHEALGISIEVKKPNLNVNDYLVMAYKAQQQKQLPVAAQYYEEILAHRPRNDDAMLGLATVEHRMGNLSKARTLYRQLLSSAPRDESVLNNFLVLVSQESPEAALEELLQLEAKNPNYDVLPAQIASIYANKGSIEKAVEKMARAIQLNPENLLYHYNLAVMLDHAGRHQQAIPLYKRVQNAALKGQKIPTDISYIQERLTFLLSNRTS